MENGGMRDTVGCETPRRFSFRDLLTRRPAPENRIGLYKLVGVRHRGAIPCIHTHTHIYIQRI